MVMVMVMVMAMMMVMVMAMMMMMVMVMVTTLTTSLHNLQQTFHCHNTQHWQILRQTAQNEPMLQI
jgi:predicted Holliday junction resolvase-like endonuclease